MHLECDGESWEEKFHHLHYERCTSALKLSLVLHDVCFQSFSFSEKVLTDNTNPVQKTCWKSITITFVLYKIATSPFLILSNCNPLKWFAQDLCHRSSHGSEYCLCACIPFCFLRKMTENSIQVPYSNCT